MEGHRGGRRRPWRGPAAGLAAAGLVAAQLALSASTAGAAGDRPFHLTTVTPENSTVSAGYVSSKPKIKTIAATMEVPKITSCAATAPQSGLGPVVILVGAKYFVGAGAEASCQAGATLYQVAINHNGNETKFLNVAPADEVTVLVSRGATTVSITVTDATSGHHVHQSVPEGKVSEAIIGDDTLQSGNVPLPVPPFTDHRFTAVKINGAALSKAVPLARETLVDSKGKVLILPSKLSSTGEGFTMHYQASK